MTVEDRLNSLLDVWREQHARGNELSAVELCQDCPELATELDERIRAVRVHTTGAGRSSEASTLETLQLGEKKGPPARRA